MADDQSTKTMDINDLVRELSKSSTSPGTPSPTPQVSRPPFPTQKPITPPSPMAGSPSAPSVPRLPISITPVPPPIVNPKPFSQPIQPKPAPSSATPLPTPGVKEYQSSIRTMNEDISNLKQGQKPTGIDVPRKVEQVAMVPQVVPPKPTVPNQQFKVPSVNLGEAQKTGPLAQSKDFSRPAPVTPHPVPIVPKVEPKPQIYVPQEGQRSTNRNMLFVGIVIIAIVAGFAYWFFKLRLSSPEVVVESPTPSPTATPVHDLNTIFASATEIEPLVQINRGEFRKDSQLFNTPGLKVKLREIIEGVGSKYPVEMWNILGIDASVLWYGQKENFDNEGQLKIEIVSERRLVIVSEITDTVLATQALSSWESSMSEDLKLLITTDKSIGYKGLEVKEFFDNNYNGVSIRYKNFSYADKSIDYAVVTASNGKSYLVISGSRESMYATIDKLKGF